MRDATMRGYNEDTVAKGGQNGLFLIILLLSWWAKKVSNGVEWMEAVGDVCCTLKAILEGPSKRASEALQETPTAPPRKR